MTPAGATLGLILVSALAGSGAETTSKEITFEGLTQSDTRPVFDHGFVVRWGRDPSSCRTLSLYARDGQQLYETCLKLSPKTSAPNDIAVPVGVAVDTDGSMAVAYHAQSGIAVGIALLDHAGTPIRFVETQPYSPSALCFAPDHSLWVFGSQRSRPEADFLVFRKYSREGKQLGAFIPRSRLPNWEGQGIDQTLGPLIGASKLHAAKDRLGALFMPGPFKKDWVELDLDGNLLGQWQFSVTQEEGFEPAAFTSDGTVYGYRWINRELAGAAVLDKTTDTWKPAPSLPTGHLIGADGDRLVFQRGDRILWAP